MKKIPLVVLSILLSTAFIFAQAGTTGRLIGTVSSPDGVLPGAVVTITDNQTGRELTATTTDDGGFNFPSLSVGTYTLKVTASGFKTYTAEKLKIDVAREYTLGVSLEIGAVSENVTVTAGADIVNAAGADLSTTVSPRQVLELPLNGRNPLGLVGLQAGATQNRGNGSEIINGGRTSSTNFTRDGVNVQDIFIRNGASTDNPTVDNTGEFTVVTGNAGAELGYGASQVQLSTPRGGKKFHGALWEYNRNSVLAANNYFNNAAGRYTANETAVLQGRATVGDLHTPRPFLNRNQFGGKVSGPVPVPHFGEGGPMFDKGKVFFFFTTERLIQRQQFTAGTKTILRPDARNGIFSYRPTGTPAAGQCITFVGGVCTVNVLSGAGTVGGTIPAAAQGPLPIDPLIASRFLANIPTAGNRPDVGDGLNTIGLTFNQSAPQSAKEYTGRIDANLNDKNSINGVYRFNDTFQPVQDTSYKT
ncbi:MAG TPA: carboxypeptidase-like regulatory domain-containing protein, partial [Pyrinomonadaceae bacterium]|nr:carboxypeptidase-like regulatory domain-containing protein [Pyrinomonadaceae bacterium]